MKKITLTIAAVLLTLLSLNAQDSLLANYPLVSDGLDITGNNEEMTLINAPFQNGGVYSNGIYLGNNEDGCEITTPTITDFNFDDFSVRLDFKIESYTEGKKPIIICGPSWRWMGAFTENDKLALMLNDMSDYFLTDEVVPLNQWNTLELSYIRNLKMAMMYLNGKLVSAQQVPMVEHNLDNRFTNEHGGNGLTFKGYWRDLSFFKTSQIAGIGDNNEIEGLVILVNRNRLQVTVPQDEKSVRMQIVNLNGVTLNTFELQAGTNNINTTTLRLGTYLLVFANEEGHRTVKKVMIAN